MGAGFWFHDVVKRDLEPGVPRAEVPFETTYETAHLNPGKYELKGWTIDGAGTPGSQTRVDVEVLPLPVMPEFEVAPLVIANSRWFVGLQISGLPKGARIYVWGQFRALGGVKRLSIHRTSESRGVWVYDLKRKLLIQGRPSLIVEAAPASHYKRNGVRVRARILTGTLLRSRRTKDTVFKTPRRLGFCTTRYGVLKNGTFPPVSSCRFAGGPTF